MVRGEHCIDTRMKGNFTTNWQGLKRSINLIPFCFNNNNNNNNNIINICVTIIILLEPFVLLPFSFYLISLHWSRYSSILSIILTTTNIAIVILIVCSINITQLRICLLSRQFTHCYVLSYVL